VLRPRPLRDGGDSRQRLGLTGAGPRRIITDLGVLQPDPDTFEFVLTGIYRGTSVADVKDRTGWDLRVSAELAMLPPPSDSELTALRRLLATMPASDSSRSSPPISTVEGAVR